MGLLQKACINMFIKQLFVPNCMVFGQWFRRRRQTNALAPSTQENEGQRTVALGDPYRTAEIISSKPRLEVLEKYILVRDVRCVDAQGDTIEFYPELLVARDVERKNGKAELLTSYAASAKLGEKGKWLPSR